MAESKIPVFPFDKVAKVEISGGFYVRVSQLLMTYAQQQGVTDLIKFLEEMKTREPKTDFEYHLMTLLTLVSSIETAAKDQKLLELKSLPPHGTEEMSPGN